MAKGTGNSSAFGAGVGDYGNDDLWVDEVAQVPVDNSGIQRPDGTDAKGLTDRGPGQARDDLLPTRVSGKIGPGGPMPSVTMKGLHLKGVSKVEFQEKIAEAQAEAQNAINQDQIPRSYRGAVKSYFDTRNK
jgi:hypothetical protein